MAVTYIEAAVLVLGHEKRPLSIEQITTVAIQRGLLITPGKTPAQSMKAALYLELGRPQPRVRKVAEQSRIRARRGSVRWATSDGTEG